MIMEWMELKEKEHTGTEEVCYVCDSPIGSVEKRHFNFRFKDQEIDILCMRCMKKTQRLSSESDGGVDIHKMKKEYGRV